MNTIFVVGAGVMGSGIAEAFASHGYFVYLYDEVESTVHSAIHKMEERLSNRVLKNKITEEEKTRTLSNIKAAEEFIWIKEADLVLDAIHEELSSKIKLFQKAEDIVKETVIFATNTSSLSITDMASALVHKERLLGMHFFNPASSNPLVEVIGSEFTAAEYIEQIMELTAKLEKEPVRSGESPGFIVNRLLIPMINEAISIFANNVASKEDIDKAMVFGANHPMGPLALADFIGNDVVLAILNTFYSATGEKKYIAHPFLKELVDSNKLGKKTNHGFYDYGKDGKII